MASAESRWRRWHRISGALALGLFLVGHLVTNASVVAGETAYRRVVVAAAGSPVIVAVQLLVLVALGVHAGYGLVLLKRPGSDAAAERYGDRRLWAAQRALATIVLVFLAVHLGEVAIPRLTAGLSPNAYYTVLAAHLSWTWAGVPWLAVFYLVGLAATATHFANGLFAAAGGRAETGKRVRRTTIALGIVLFLLGAAAVVSFATGTRLLPGPTEEPAACGPSAVPAPLRIRLPAPAGAP